MSLQTRLANLWATRNGKIVVVGGVGALLGVVAYMRGGRAQEQAAAGDVPAPSALQTWEQTPGDSVGGLPILGGGGSQYDGYGGNEALSDELLTAFDDLADRYDELSEKVDGHGDRLNAQWANIDKLKDDVKKPKPGKPQKPQKPKPQKPKPKPQKPKPKPQKPKPKPQLPKPGKPKPINTRPIGVTPYTQADAQAQTGKAPSSPVVAIINQRPVSVARPKPKPTYAARPANKVAGKTAPASNQVAPKPPAQPTTRPVPQVKRSRSLGGQGARRV